MNEIERALPNLEPDLNLVGKIHISFSMLFFRLRDPEFPFLMDK